MPLVKVRRHRQVVIPKELFEKLELKEGDYLEVKLQNSKLVYIPKRSIDRDIAEALKEIKEGKFKEFDNVEDLIRELNA